MLSMTKTDKETALRRLKFFIKKHAVVLIAAAGAIVASRSLGAPVTDLRVLPGNRIAAVTDTGAFMILQ